MRIVAVQRSTKTLKAAIWDLFNDGGVIPIFIGVIKRLFVHQINRQYLAEAHVVTLSAKLDEKKKSRSFQNPDMTYAELIRTVLQDTPNAAAICSAGEGITIGRPHISI